MKQRNDLNQDDGSEAMEHRGIDGLDADEDLLFGSRGPIHTAPGDLDDTKRSTEAGLGFVVALLTLLLVALLALLGWWATGAVWLGVRP